MKTISNYNDIKASDGEFNRLPAGGYICKILKVEDVPLNESTGKGDYLKIEYDIADGEYKGYWLDTQERAGFWGGSFIRSYKEKALGMFKAFTNAVEESNANVKYQWAWDEQSLVGKFIGLVLGEEEYEKKDGSIGVRLYVKSCVSGQKIRANDFKVPELKKLSSSTSSAQPSSTVAYGDTEFEVTSGDIPF